MTTTRQDFLNRVRQAVAAGNSAGRRPEHPSRGGIGYQGGGADLVQHFCEQFTVAGGIPIVVPDHDTAAARVLDLVRGKSPQRVVLGSGPYVDQLNLAPNLLQTGVALSTTSEPVAKEQFFAADLSISAVDYLIAETGSLVVSAKPHDPRSVSLIAPVHIAIAGRGQLLPDLFDLFARVPGSNGQELPSCLTLITGPSKTGDIELKLVTGVHGPKEVHVILIDSA
jgi:L-lactate dehydrogenase complex protein LldG